MCPNIACSGLGCSNPVIGQCPGYKGGCGRYHCATHSTEGLCADCARQKLEDDMESERQKLEDDIYDDYLQAAKRLGRKVNRLGSVIGIITFAPLAVVGYVAVYTLATGERPFLTTVHDTEILSYVVVFGTLGGSSIFATIKQRKIEKAGVAEISKEKPAFPEFYKDWKKKKVREALTAGLAVAGVITVAAIAAAAGSGSRERRVREVEEGVRRAQR